MRVNQLTVPLAALTIALGSFAAEAQERAERRGRQGQVQGAARQGGSRAERNGQQPDRPRADSPAERRPNQVRGGGGERRDSREYGRSGSQEPRREYDRGRSGDRRPGYNNGYSNHGYSGHGGSYGHRGGSYGYRGYGYGGYYGAGYGYSRYYYAPRPIPWRMAPPRYYGPGGHLSIHFGFGSGYLYGSAYTGRVYGYRAPAPVYGSYQYYGDVRLRVNPRDAAVYVDGYYAGVVDDFDGSRPLVLQAGPHKIEIAARGVEPQAFDVYVDSARTVELHADLLR